MVFVAYSAGKLKMAGVAKAAPASKEDDFKIEYWRFVEYTKIVDVI